MKILKIFTIGFAKKTAEEFFAILYENEVQIVIDTRINTMSQLSGFAKSIDLKYFLNKICNIKYDYRSDFAPTTELLKDYRDKKISWEEYIPLYEDLLDKRKTYKNVLEDYKNYNNVCLLCSEAENERCHRRLLADKIHDLFPNLTEIIHL